MIDFEQSGSSYFVNFSVQWMYFLMSFTNKTSSQFWFRSKCTFYFEISINLQQFEKCDSQVLFWKRGQKTSVCGRSDFLLRLWKLRESNFVSGITDNFGEWRERYREEIPNMSLNSFLDKIMNELYLRWFTSSWDWNRICDSSLMIFVFCVAM